MPLPIYLLGKISHFLYTTPVMNPFSSNSKGKKGGSKNPNNQTFTQSLVSVVVFLVAISLLYSLFTEGQKIKEEISLSQVAEAINVGDVDTIVVRGDKLEILLISGEEQISKKEREASLSESLVNFGVESAALAEVDLDIKNESGFSFWLMQLLPFLLPLIFILFFLWYLSRQIKGGPGMKAFNFGQSKARVTDPDKQKITFKDVAGVKEAKEELAEVVQFLKHPKKFLDIGAKIPKGVLLMGEPGTGKTLLARAVAGEAKVPFFHLSGSEFVEMFVGVGASRVRDLFDMAKKASPAIIFIDEIDAVGRSRGVGIGGGNDEREQTLNQILVEMDGFEPTDKLIVVAATNRPDVLDSALLRPGRFDRRVILDAPDRGDRLQILEIHARNKPLAKDVKLSVIAERTPGFSGADLESLMNEAAILAARGDRKEVAQDDLVRSIEKVMIGPERKSHLHTEKDRKITAYHEAGHAVLASVLKDSDPVHKVSIVARGHAGGYTMKIPLEENNLRSSKEMLDDIVMTLGGYSAEKLIFGDTTTGPSSDLNVVSKTARAMVLRYGMSSQIGPMSMVNDTRDQMTGVRTRQHSEETQSMIDGEIKRIVSDSLARADSLLSEHRTLLDAVANALLEKETLDQDDYNIILEAHGITPKKAPETAVKPKVVEEPTNGPEDSSSLTDVEADDELIA